LFSKGQKTTVEKKTVEKMAVENTKDTVKSASISHRTVLPCGSQNCSLAKYARELLQHTEGYG
jgi:cob(I)alamin adenosyltransferase